MLGVGFVEPVDFYPGRALAEYGLMFIGVTFHRLRAGGCRRIVSTSSSTAWSASCW
jgi:hypothetical protein